MRLVRVSSCVDARTQARSATTPRKVFKFSENGPAGVSLPDRFA
jgi:hypothetical protein